MGYSLRTLLAVPGMLLVMGVVAAAFFAAPSVLQSGTLSSSSGGTPGTSPTIITLPGNAYSITGSFPVTVAYQNLPAGSSIAFVLCSSSVLSACAGASPIVVAHAFSGSVTFTMGAGQALVIYTSATEAQYRATVPYSALDSLYVIVIAVAGLILTVVGIALKDPIEKRENEPPQTSENVESSEEGPMVPAPPGSDSGDWTQ